MRQDQRTWFFFLLLLTPHPLPVNRSFIEIKKGCNSIRRIKDDLIDEKRMNLL